MTNQPIITTSTDPFTRGLDYLYGVRSLALDPDMVDLVYDLQRRSPVCTWIGQHIDAVNTQLKIYLHACHACLQPWERPSAQIFAAPLSQPFGIDGLCNFHTTPITLLIDIGRVVPADWLKLVVHEYAHAHTGSPGHHTAFARSLKHLCQSLAIPLPDWNPGQESILRSYPHCIPTQDPLACWRGEGGSQAQVLQIPTFYRNQ